MNIRNNNGSKFSSHSLYQLQIINNKLINISRYEQSKVYQYLKQSDLTYNLFVERKQTLLNSQRLAYVNYAKRREEFCNEKNFQSSVLSIAKSFIFRQNRLIKMQDMKEQLIEYENKRKQLLISKIDKMKAWENAFQQPMKYD